MSREGWTDAEVSFEANGSTTYGTLSAPGSADGGRYAAALLIAGSGPVDRDGDQLGQSTGTLKLLASVLTDLGIATLRYDKYFSGRTGTAAVPAAEMTISQDFTQADAAYGFLADQPGVDPDKILVVGHSEGAMIGLHVATVASLPPAGLALLEPQHQRILDNLGVQIAQLTRQQLAIGELTAEEAQQSNRALVRVIASLRASRPGSSAGMSPLAMKILGRVVNEPNTRYVVSWDAVDPTALAADVRPGTRVLVTDGTRDASVTTGSLGPFLEALTTAGMTGPGLRVISGADNQLQPQDGPEAAPTLADGAVSALREWAQPYAAAP